jgi:hypothetical protein
MDGSLMFIIYPSTLNGVTVSLRTASGHDTPDVLVGPKVLVQSSKISHGMMIANVLCYNCTDWTGGKGLNVQSSSQPWIWATGPGGNQRPSNNQDAEIEKHEKYGKHCSRTGLASSNWLQVFSSSTCRRLSHLPPLCLPSLEHRTSIQKRCLDQLPSL